MASGNEKKLIKKLQKNISVLSKKYEKAARKIDFRCEKSDFW